MIELLLLPNGKRYRLRKNPSGNSKLNCIFDGIIPYYYNAGVPDLVRDRSLLPKRMMDESYKGESEANEKNEINELPVPVGDTLALPLKLTLGFFNGERWSSNFFNPGEAPYENGSIMLKNELDNTQHCLSTCR